MPRAESCLWQLSSGGGWCGRTACRWCLSRSLCEAFCVEASCIKRLKTPHEATRTPFKTPRAMAMAGPFPVREVRNTHKWIDSSWSVGLHPRFSGLIWCTNQDDEDPPPERVYWELDGGDGGADRTSDVELIRQIYGFRIGEMGTHWSRNFPIHYRHAKVKMSDVVDFFTSSDGVLEIPSWSCFKFAVDEYLEAAEAARKFHTSRVREYIDDHGADQLEDME